MSLALRAPHMTEFKIPVTDLSELADKLKVYQSNVGRPFRRLFDESALPRHRMERAHLIDRKLRQSLLSSQTDQFIDADHPFFERCRAKVDEMRQVIGFTDESVDNMFRLVQGNLRYPPLILHNPRMSQDRSYRSMIEETDTLSWLESVLADIGLHLDDMVIIDRFPLLTGEILLQLTPDQCQWIVEQSFDMTQDFLQTFAPEIVVSCYCNSPSIFLPKIQRINSDPFRSSIIGAEEGDVNITSLDEAGKDISIIQAFHPSYGIRTLDERRELRLKAILREIYEPCAKWKQMRAFEDLNKCLAKFHSSCATLMVALERAADAGLSMQTSLRSELRQRD